MRISNCVKTVLFLTLCIGLVAMLNNILQIDDGGIGRQNMAYYYDEESNSLDAVYIGGSDVFTFWNAPVAWGNHGIAVWPYSNNYQSLYSAEGMIREARKTNPNALYIVNANFNDVEEATVHSCIHRMPLSQSRVQLTNRLADLAGVAYESRAEFYLPLIRFHERWDSLTRNDFEFVSKGYKGGYDSEKYLWAANDYGDKRYITNKSSVLDQAMTETLDSLLAYAESEGFKILFVITPQAIGSDRVEEIEERNAIKDYVTKRGFKVLDLLGDSQLHDLELDLNHDYYDSFHANIHGACKYTQFLSGWLMKEYGFKDKRGVERFKSWDDAFDRYVDEVMSICTLPFEYDGSLRMSSLAAPKIVKDGAIDGYTIWDPLSDISGYGVFVLRSDTTCWEHVADVAEGECHYKDERFEVGNRYAVAAYKLVDGTVRWGEAPKLHVNF